MRTFIEKRMLLGLLLLIAGILLMLHYYAILPWVLPHYVFSWKMLLVVLGIFFMITEKNKSTGIILFLIGSVFIAGEIFKMPSHRHCDLWQDYFWQVQYIFLFFLPSTRSLLKKPYSAKVSLGS